MAVFIPPVDACSPCAHVFLVPICSSIVMNAVFAPTVARDRRDRPERVLHSALTVVLTHVGVTWAYNVFLEAPYTGQLFSTTFALRACSVDGRPRSKRVARTAGD
jgi:hypothetical protein